MEHTHAYPHSVYVHCELSHQCTHINIEGYSHTWAQRCRCLQVCPHTSYHSMHGCPSQAQPQGGRLHDRGMQTSRDALPADVRERLRGNHVGRNPGRRARLRRGPRVAKNCVGGGARADTCSSLTCRPVSLELLGLGVHRGSETISLSMKHITGSLGLVCLRLWVVVAGSEQEAYATTSLSTAVSTGICRKTVINTTLHV